MKINILQHEHFEGAGLIEEWALANGHIVTVTMVCDNEALPLVNSFDWLVIMGGGMSVNDENKYAWLKPEKALVREAIEAKKLVLGICLGSQMIASALGKKVYKSPVKEIGWWPVQLTNEGMKSQLLSDICNNQVFFHWHGETFDLPQGAVHLATTIGCVNQAFSISNRVFGFQFHPETNLQTLTQMVNAGNEELVKDEYVMNEREILALTGTIEYTKPLLYELLDKILAQAAAGM